MTKSTKTTSSSRPGSARPTPDRVDFQDALNAIPARDAGIAMIVSYDAHFDHIGFVERREPSEVFG